MAGASADMAATACLLALCIAPYLLETWAPADWRVRRWTSDHLSFCGATLRTKPWTPVTSSFLHDSASHTAKEVLPILLLGSAVEETVGPAIWFIVFIVAGAVAAIVSWQCLRRRLLLDPEYAAWDRNDVEAIANHAESRGASASIYGIATFATAVAGPADSFGAVTMGSSLARLLIALAPLVHDALRWNRCVVQPQAFRRSAPIYFRQLYENAFNPPISIRSCARWFC